MITITILKGKLTRKTLHDVLTTLCHCYVITGAPGHHCQQNKPHVNEIQAWCTKTKETGQLNRKFCAARVHLSIAVLYIPFARI